MRFNTPAEGAVWLSLRGMKVFPLSPYSKIPASQNWQDWANKSTPKRVKEYGTANPTHNWGVFCGASNITVIDIDVKRGDGLAEYKAAVAAANEKHTATFIVVTPSGGWHLYYQNATRSCKFTPNIDVQSKGKYVVAPGSKFEGNEYYIKNDSQVEIMTLPLWIQKKIQEKEFKEPETVGETVIEGERNKTFISIAGTMRRRGMGYDEIYAALDKLNERTAPPLSEREIQNICNTVSKYKPEEAVAAAAFEEIENIKCRRVSDIKFNSIPKRNWIMKNRYIGGFVSVTIAPGGLGKSTLVIADGLSVATGSPFINQEVLCKGAVWIYNTEDPEDEADRRVTAACLHYGIPEGSVSNMFLSSARSHPFIVAKSTKDGIVVNRKTIEFAVEFIRENGIVLFIIDPFVKCHQCNENDNMEIDTVVGCFAEIAERTGCAIGLVHHTSKGGALANLQTSDPSAYSARGASALINAARIANVITPMSEAEAKSFNIPEVRRGWYFRLDNAKANLQPPAERADWFERVSVVLSNNDFVGAIKSANLIEEAKVNTAKFEISEKREVAMYLDTILSYTDPIKAVIPVADIIETMQFMMEFEGVFDFARKIDKQRKLIGMLQESGGMIYRTKMFKYKCEPTKAKKHWIECIRKNEEGLDLADPTLCDLSDDNFMPDEA